MEMRSFAFWGGKTARQSDRSGSVIRSFGSTGEVWRDCGSLPRRRFRGGESLDSGTDAADKMEDEENEERRNTLWRYVVRRADRNILVTYISAHTFFTFEAICKSRGFEQLQ
jgi:hypothetical protein